MVTFAGKSFDTVDALLSGGSAAALGSLAKTVSTGGRAAPETVVEELRRLALADPDLFGHAFDLGRMAGEINCVWRRVEARLDDPEPTNGRADGQAPASANGRPRPTR